ncbi:MAG: 3TM-type holin [Polaromonas sp.]|nr:3TM-type holin [Polaromonas sp.]
MRQTNWFIVAGRPAAMWVCVFGLAYQFVLVPLVTFGYQLWTGEALPIPAPALDENLWELLAGLLGLAGWRSWDKKNGAASS